MKIIKNLLCEVLPIRTENNYPIKGVEFIDITPMLMDFKIFNRIIELFSDNIKSINNTIDYIVAPDARGFILGAALSHNNKIGFIPVRKKNKLPPSVIEIEFSYDKEYGNDTLCLPKLNNNEKYDGKNFYIVDDVYATGNTANSIAETITKLGGNVEKIATLINIKDLNNNQDIYSIIDIKENS